MFLKQIKNLLKNIFPAKKLALFATLAVVLVLGFSFSLTNTSRASFTMDASQKATFATTYQEQRKSAGLPAFTDQQMNDMIKAYENKYSSFNEATKALNDTTSGDRVSASVNQFSPSALGGAIGGWFASIVWNVVIGVLAILAYFCKVLLMFGGKAMDATLNPSLYNFTSNPMVTGGWIIVRDVCNLFFLLVLLFIAICTILKIEKYHAKKTLLMLIIMALLINFSKPIAVFIFDGSQLLMNMFLSQISSANGQGTPSVKLVEDIAKFLYTDLTTELGTKSGSMEIAVYYLFVVVFLFMFAVALFVTAIFLVIRIVAVMILIIVSPLAFFAAIVPDFSKMSSSWWNALFKYCYYGPAAAFFLFLATKFALGTAGSVLPHLNAPGETSNVISHLILYLTVLVFLYASIIMSQQFGIAAAGAIVGNAKRFMKWAGGMTKGGGMWGGAARVTGAADVYKGTKAGIGKQPYWRVLTKEGREARSKEQQEKYERKVAPFSMADARKRAKDNEFKDQTKVDAGVLKGNADDILIASKRGTLKEEQLESDAVKNIISKNPELRKETLGNLRDKGQTHLAAYLRYLTRAQDDTESKDWSLEQFGEREIYDNKKLADMDWKKVLGFDKQGVKFKPFLVNRMKHLAETNPQGFLNTVSGFDGTKMDILRNDPTFGPMLSSAREAARGGRRNETGGYQSSGYGP